MDLLQKIRNKPEEERKKILFVVVTIFMLIIVYVWFTTVHLSILGIGDEQAVADENNKIEKFSPFQVIYTKIFDFSATIRDAVDGFGAEKKEVFKRENI